jgi:PAS domain S-box-containing protein
MHIGFASQNPGSHYWQIVNYGVRERATELGITVTTIPAYTLEQQLAAIDTLTQQHIDVLLLGPCVAVGLGAAVDRVLAAGVPVVVLAAELSDIAVPCTVRSDHRHGAELAAAFLVGQLEGAGAVAHLIGPSRLQDNIDRAAGVRHVLAQHPGIDVVFEAECADWEPETAAALMRAALEQFPAIRGACVANDTLALGALTAIEAAGRTGEIVVTGFDAIPSALIAIHEGRLHATVQQSIRGIGRAAVDKALRIFQGQPVPPLVYTDLSLITRTNLIDAALESTVMLPGILTDVFERGEVLAQARDAVIQAQREAQAVAQRSAEEVRALNQFLGRVIDDAPVWLMVLDAQSRVTIWNKAAEAISGYTRDEVLGAGDPIWERLYPDAVYRDEVLARGVAYLAVRGAIDQYETSIRRKDGQQRQIVWNTRSLFDEREGADSTLVFGLDITERKQAEEARLLIERKLLDTQKLESLGVLAGGIAHDFNNLLVAILGNADLALMELPDADAARASIEKIEIAARRAADLTRQMLAYAGKGRFVVERIALNTVVDEMAHLLEVAIPKNVALTYQFAADLPDVEADVTQIRQVVMNLVVNAAEAIGEQAGTITVTTGVRQLDHSAFAGAHLSPELPAGAYVYLEVADTGRGMDAETQAQIFNPFFTTKFTGRGLGLAAVLGIARGHHGAVHVSSEVGRGSTFTFLLPASVAPAAAGAAEQPQFSAWRGEGVILVVDDEAEVRAVAARMLERLGLRYLLADNGLAGIEILRAHAEEVSCVLLDLTMPRMSGEQTFARMRQIKPNVRVVLMSGYNEQEIAGQFAGKGLAGFLHKPFTSAELRAKLWEALVGPAERSERLTGW